MENKDRHKDKNTSKDKSMLIHKAILIILGIGIIASAIALSQMNDIGKIEDTAENENIAESVIEEKVITPREDNIEIVKNKEEVNLDYIISKTTSEVTEDENIDVDKLGINIKSGDSVVEDVEIANSIAGESLNLTRFQFVDILYKILLRENKLPQLEGYQVAYEDNADIPSKYLNAVVYTTYLELNTFGNKFDGYKLITKVEADIAFEKLEVYLGEYVGYTEEENEDIEDRKESEEKSLERIALEEEAARILRDRKPVDRLGGQSVAIFKEPKTLAQLEANQNAVIKVDLDKASSEINYGTDGDILNIEYINIEEGLLDFSNIKLDYTLNGLTYVDGIKFNVKTVYDMFTLLSNSLVESGEYGPFFDTMDYLGIKDNKVVSQIRMLNENEVEGLIVQDIEIDSVGIVLNKFIIENSNNEVIRDSEATFILAVIKLDEHTVNMIKNSKKEVREYANQN